MSEIKPTEWVPTQFFGFNLENGSQVLHQKWVDGWGNEEWRPVPMIEIKRERAPCSAGFLEGDDGQDN